MCIACNQTLSRASTIDDSSIQCQNTWLRSQDPALIQAYQQFGCKSAMTCLDRLPFCTAACRRTKVNTPSQSVNIAYIVSDGSSTASEQCLWCHTFLIPPHSLTASPPRPGLTPALHSGCFQAAAQQLCSGLSAIPARCKPAVKTSTSSSKRRCPQGTALHRPHRPV